MKYCPGSHLFDWNATMSYETIFSKSLTSNLEYINCSGKKGDMFLFSSNGIHSGTRNLTVRRDCIILKFLPLVGRNFMVDLHPKVK